MSVMHLPDEIINKLLAHIMSVSDADFEHGGQDHAMESPFVRYGQLSTSVLLLVCKDWLRVGTPLLYHTVILRSTAQAQALDSALMRTPELGKFIRRLRLEGGFGFYVQGVCAIARNIEALALPFDYAAKDSTSGIQNALPTMDLKYLVMIPSYRITCTSSFPSNKNTDALNASVHEMIPRWKRLREITICPMMMFTFRLHSWWPIWAGLARALKGAPQLRVLNVAIDLTFKLMCPVWLEEAVENQHLEVVAFRRPRTKDWDELEPRLSPRLRALAKFAEEKEADVAKWPAQTSFPLTRAPTEVQRKIWREVLGYFFRIYETGFDHPFDRSFSTRKKNKTRLRYALVCREFHHVIRELHRELHHSFIINSPSSLEEFQRVLRENPAASRHLTCLFLCKRWRPAYLLPQDFLTAHNLSSLICIRGESKDATRISGDSFKHLLQTGASTLLELNGVQIIDKSGIVDATLFHKLAKIQIFYWDSTLKISMQEMTPSPECFRYLRALWCVGTTSFLDFMEACELPALRILWIRRPGPHTIPFFEKHGAKIDELRMLDAQLDMTPFLSLCPNLTLLKFSSAGANTSLACDPPHRKLAKVIVCSDAVKRHWDTFFESIDRGNLPALDEIRIDAFSYPVAEYDIIKNPWVARAETLLKEGIQLVDRRGWHWTSRLRVQRTMRG
ncbi:hypothetical protein BD626DRAFT_117931 [Schizophyllum amplum]|uniref:Uncharacterized protein n=1 Tax=Schizophyllum amplum TaxID=97359 RepID=A0A550CUU0_9AGAR|nr:hypothetical protein BD626DRAFT_117931 [Auriculariopsis ampla]